MDVRIPSPARFLKSGKALALLLFVALAPVALANRTRPPAPLAVVAQAPSGIGEPRHGADALVGRAITLEFLRPMGTALFETAKESPDVRLYRGKQYRFVKTLSLRVTAYAPDPRCTYPYDGTTTASGLPVTTNGGRLVASDPAVIPLHWLVVVPGYAGDRAVPVLDRGGAIKGHRLDVLLLTFEQAKSWGVRTLDVRVYQPVPKG
jgi:3D (Asp-Asp-Asp) domain-containing protein